MAKVLVIWDEVPESLCFVEVEVGEADLALLLSFHQQWINGGSTPNELSEDIYNFFYIGNDFRFEKKNGPMEGTYDKIILTGFVM